MGTTTARAVGTARRMRIPIRRADWLAILFIVVVVFCYLSPAIKDGASFGPTDIGEGLSYLTHVVPAPLNHNVINGDVINQDAAWATLNWQLVHQGHLPLWNDLSGTGLPQFLNFESAPLALPSLVSYAFPLSLAFLVTIAMKLLIAGIGAYVACRVMRARPLAALFGGVTFMVSGAFSGWLGWAVSGPVAWIGWIVAGLILCYRLRRVEAIGLLAVSVAFAIYGGFPETYVLIALGLAVVLIAAALASSLSRVLPSWQGTARIGAGLIAGVALGAPLWLPGLSLLSGSARAAKQAGGGLPLHAFLLTFAQGFYGLPLQPPKNPASGSWFGLTTTNYFESAAYLGVIALVLATVAVVVSIRRPLVAGLSCGSLACLLVVYRLSGGPVQRLLRDVGLGTIALQRMLTVLAFFVAALAAIGLETLLTRWREPRLQWLFAGVVGIFVLFYAVLWARSGSGLPAVQAALRRRSLYWPTATVVVLGVVAVLAWRTRTSDSGRAGRAVSCVAAGLVVMQSAFLIFAGVGINSYAKVAYPITPAVSAFSRLVGNHLVGLDAGNTSCVGAPTPLCGFRSQVAIGFYPQENLAYGIDELGMHDPIIPKAYLNAWPVPDAGQDFSGNLNYFLPALTSAALARRYGASYILVGPDLAAPSGTLRVATITVASGEHLRLYRVPRSGRFTISGTKPRVLSSSHSGDASYSVSLGGGPGGLLTARITDVSGWHASADGRALPIRHVDGSFLAVEVPPKTTTVTFTYWPNRLSDALVLALLAAVALLAGVVVGLWRQRSSQNRRQGSVPLIPSTGD